MHPHNILYLANGEPPLTHLEACISHGFPTTEPICSLVVDIRLLDPLLCRHVTLDGETGRYRQYYIQQTEPRSAHLGEIVSFHLKVRLAKRLLMDEWEQLSRLEEVLPDETPGPRFRRQGVDIDAVRDVAAPPPTVRIRRWLGTRDAHHPAPQPFMRGY